MIDELFRGDEEFGDKLSDRERLYLCSTYTAAVTNMSLIPRDIFSHCSTICNKQHSSCICQCISDDHRK